MPRFISQVFDLAQVPGKGMGSSLLKSPGRVWEAHETTVRMFENWGVRKDENHRANKW